MSYCWPASQSVFPERAAVAGGHVDLEAELAGEGDAEEPRREAGDRAFGHRHVREGFVREVDALDKRREQLAGVRALERDDRPLLGGRGEPDLEVRPLGLEVVLHHVEDARGAAGGGGDVEAVRGQPADDAVVADEAVLAEQQAVAAAAEPELRPGVGVHPLHEGRRRRGRRPRSCRASRRRTCRRLARAARHSRRPRRACPRRAAGSTRRGARARPARRRRRWPRPSCRSASCA